MPAPTAAQRMDALEIKLDRVLAALVATSAPTQAATQSTTRTDNGKVCTCGHEHKRPVVAAQRARLATEPACFIKGCVTGCVK